MRNRKLKKGAAPKLVVSILLIVLVSYLSSALTYGIFTQIELLDAIQDPSGVVDFLSSTELANLLIPVILSILFAAWVINIVDIWEKKYEDADEYGLHGTSKWADIKSLQDGKTLAKSSKSLYKTGNFKEALKMQNGYILGKVPDSNKVLIMHDRTDIDNQNVMVIGSSGAAKSQAYVLPNLVNVRNKSIIVTDPKGELYDMTAQLKADQGYKVYQIDFIHFLQSRYNPLDFVENDLQAQTVANTIISNFGGESSNDAFFKNSATNMLSALIIYVKTSYPKEEANMDTLIDVYTNYIQNEDIFNQWIETVSTEHPAKPMLNSILDLTGNTRGSVTSTLNNGLSIFKLQKVRHMTKVSDFKIENFVEQKSILYVKLSMEDDTFAPLTSVFFSQMLDIFYDIAKKSPGQTLPKPVMFLLDEFANIGKINKYSRVLATCRSLGISMHTIIQNIAQLQDKSMYGPDATKAILSNHDTTIILRAKQEDTTTTTWISKALGDTTKKQQKDSFNLNKSGTSKSINYEYVKRPLMTPDEVGKLEKHECIVMISGRDPIFCHKAFQYEVYKGLLTNEKRQPNYINVRGKLGHTTPLLKKPFYEIEEELSFSEYQKQLQNREYEKMNEHNKQDENELTDEEIELLFANSEDVKPKEEPKEQEQQSEYDDELEEIEKELDKLDLMRDSIADEELNKALEELIKVDEEKPLKEEFPM